MIDKIFVCHHNTLIDRKNILKNFFEKENIEVEWVENFLPEQIENNYDKIVGTDILNFDNYQEYGWKVNIAELSLYLKHKYCFETQVKNNYNIILILEDDVLLPDNFNEYISKILLEFENHFPKLDCIMLGTCCGFKSQFIEEGKLIHYGPNQLTRCTHAMIFTLECSKKIINNLYPIDFPIDHKLNKIIIKEDLKVAWAEPPIFQRTDLNMEKSSIR